jgi:ATP-binding cassette subfamily F protein uup
LSGGQKNRLMLAKIMANPGSLLILDEPTNDLDMDTLDMLEDMLATYKGTLLVVSHDRDFLDQTVSKILAFEGNGKVDMVIGGYQDYLAKKKGREKPAEQAAVKQKAKKATEAAPIEPVAATPAVKMSYIQEYELKNLPTKIQDFEDEIAALDAQLADAELYSRDAVLFDKLTRNRAHAQVSLHHAEERWLELESLRQDGEGAI